MLEWNSFFDRGAEEARRANLARELRVFGGGGVHVSLNGRDVVSFGSNDYLGLANHPKVIEGARAAVEKFGAGATASPLICGFKTIHDELCAALADFKGSERALVFPSGYQAALSALGALGDEGCSLILDKLSHASLIDGARLSAGRVRYFSHNDLGECEGLLKKEAGRRCVVVVESLYSMDGDLAPLEELVELTARVGALLVVDEAHGTGMLGARARGGLELAGFDRLPEHVVAMGTLSKALGAQGGFVCASRRICQAMISGRAHMFSTGLNPGSAGAAIEALKLISIQAGSLHHNCELLRAKIDTPSTVGPIMPVMVGDEGNALELSRRLLEQGFFVPAVRFPTVKRGAARLRVSVSAGHTREECEKLIHVLAEKNDA